MNIDDEGVNEALEPLLLAASGRMLATMSLAAASAVDTANGRLQPELAVLGFSEDHVFKTARHQHRREHIDQIERALAGR